ncbi:uncharacterized protein LOC132751247 [Ruditapes philippinarum]|uniref:uncharacterized protein LOC132751247 n=1 Tax=Ruditapes philippinarum TaxID=129788 RepID=UPI00295BBA6D|nr:uncharacterized protein LOC132751247 [Ruditapes philippinarum]
MIRCKYRAILLFLLLIIYWNEVGAKRNRNTRRKEKCTKPDKVSNAGLKKRYEPQERFNDGDKVVYTCQPGYTMEGITMQRWCREGNWTDALFTCNHKCTKPDKVSNANLKKKYKRKRRFKDGDTVEYNCQPGYTWGGATRKRWCRKGNWTGVLFSCNSGHPYRQLTLNQDLKVNGDISTDQILAETNNKEYVGDLEFELMELDMIVDKSVKTPSSSQSFRANINKHKTRRWPLEIHYNIGDKISEVQKNAILKAILVWQRYSCLSFSEDKQAYDRIEFELAKDNMCTSYVGRKQGSQTISLGETCFETEIIVHEIGHALGFYHEHNRWDRDDYIKIHYENIEPGKKQNFQKRKNTVFDTNYDYMSIMHYGQYFFSKNKSANLITIETTNDTFQSKIGQAKHPSFQDYKTLNAMYKCAVPCAKIECPKAGFLGKNCKCYCKGYSDDTPVRRCFQKGECPRQIHNKYLFDVLEKDKSTQVSKYRTSFPDKTVLHIYSTNWKCAPVSKLRCEDGEWKTKKRSITECSVTLNISLTDNTEGVVKVTLNGYYDGYICDDDWDDNDATVACRMLGYTNGLAYFLKPQEVDESLPILLDNVHCSGNESSLADCKHNGWGNHNCRYTEVVTVKCSNSSLPYHIDITECGIIKLGNTKRKKRQLKVSGGFETIKGMHPWQVTIQRKEEEWSHLCGGTIINDKWILSAAHCFDDFEKRKLDLKDLRVIVGVHDLTKHDEYEDIFYIEYIVKHWNYSEFKRSYAINDIVLLKLKSYIIFNDFKQPACLPESSDLSETKCEVSGWGKEKENGSITDTLRAAQVAIIQEHDCRLTLGKDYPIDFGKVICAGDDGADTCQGDSGGPLICEINGKSTIIGITSWGKGCGRKEAPGVYTKVSKYLKWINNQISNHHFEEGLCNIIFF